MKIKDIIQSFLDDIKDEYGEDKEEAERLLSIALTDEEVEEKIFKVIGEMY